MHYIHLVDMIAALAFADIDLVGLYNQTVQAYPHFEAVGQDLLSRRDLLRSFLPRDKMGNSNSIRGRL